jgi:hypothetical protein
MPLVFVEKVYTIRKIHQKLTKHSSIIYKNSSILNQSALISEPQILEGITERDFKEVRQMKL